VAESFKQDLTTSERFRERKKYMPNLSHTRTHLLSYNAKMEAYARLMDPSHKTLLTEFPPRHREAMDFVLCARNTTWEKEVSKHMGRITDALAESEREEIVDKVA
jgi:hypothetical protein